MKVEISRDDSSNDGYFCVVGKRSMLTVCAARVARPSDGAALVNAPPYFVLRLPIVHHFQPRSTPAE